MADMGITPTGVGLSSTFSEKKEKKKGGQNGTATLPPSGDKDSCTPCLHASQGFLNPAALLTVELKANLRSVAQLDVQL